MVSGAAPSDRLTTHSSPGPSHCLFLIYGTGIRNALNPFACNANSVLIYGNRIPKYYVLPVSLVPGHSPELSFSARFGSQRMAGTHFHG